MPVDPRLGRRRSVRPNVRRIALRQVKGEEMHLLLDPGDNRPRFPEIRLRVPWRMRQRHEHPPAMAAMLYLGARIGNTSVNSMLKPTRLMIVFAWIPTLLPTTYIPEVALWLPGLVYGGRGWAR